MSVAGRSEQIVEDRAEPLKQKRMRLRKPTSRIRTSTRAARPVKIVPACRLFPAAAPTTPAAAAEIRIERVGLRNGTEGFFEETHRLIATFMCSSCTSSDSPKVGKWCWNRPKIVSQSAW